MGKFESYAQLTLPDIADRLLITDVSDTSMSAAGTTKYIVLSDLAKSVYPAAFNIIDYGADPTGSADSSAAITAAKTAAGAGSRNIILVPPGTYLTNPFTFDGFHWAGWGPASSILKANAGDADFATNAGVANGSVNLNEEATLIEGIGFDGTNLTGTNANNASEGVPAVLAVGNGLSGTYGWTIPTFIIRNVWVYENPVGAGIDASLCRGGRQDCHFESVIAWNNGWHGVISGSDQHWSNCVSLNNEGAGFYVDSRTSFGYTGCKAYSGLGAGGYGFHLHGQGNGGAFAGCQAQDNTAGGLYFDGAQNYNVTGLICDSNGGLNAGSAVIFGNSSTQNYVQYVAVDRSYNGGAGGTDQRYALTIDAGSTGNVIVCPDLSQNTSNGSETSAVAWLAPGSTGAGNDLQFGSPNAGQAPAYAASLTPDPTKGATIAVGALTGNIAVAAAAVAWPGARLTFFFTQDSTGGRTVSWDASFVFQAAWTNTGGTAGKRSSASFVYNGAAWMSISPAANVWY